MHQPSKKGAAIRPNLERGETALQQPVANDPARYNVDVCNVGVFRYEALYIGTSVMYHATGPSANGSNTV